MADDRIVTTAQTVGPFFRLGLDLLAVADLTGPGIVGTVIHVQGTVLDGAGQPVPDALIETWQADSSGHYPDLSTAAVTETPHAFRGFGRVATDDEGRFRLRTIKPGQVALSDGSFQAPHLVVAIFMRGLLKHLMTRVYFADEPTTASDAILSLVDPTRRRTLIATLQPGSTDCFSWDVHVQGRDETVFFDF
jgi:protocatechuate 3,4-dioxygenase, alpha subunit